MKTCDGCGKEVIFLYCKNGKQISMKANPIEAAPHPKGNLVIDRANMVYRNATAQEIEFARTHKKNLYISHFAECPKRKEFRNKNK